MSFSSFSFRNTAKAITATDLRDQKWIEPCTLAHAFGDVNVFYELGGIYGLAWGLRTSLDQGLLEDEKADGFATRKELYGENKFPAPPTHPLWRHMLDGFDEPLTVLLAIGGALSIAINAPREGLHGCIEGIALLVCVLIVISVGGYQNWSQERSFCELSTLLKDAPVTVLRHGEQRTIEAEEILVGDVLSLSPGNLIPCDGFLIDNTTIKVNESALTGESDEMVKNSKFPFLSGGTNVSDGAGSMLVTAVGVNSAKGKILSSLIQDQEMTPLQEKLETTAMQIGYLGGAVSTALLIVNCFRLVYFIYNPPHFTEKGELISWKNSFAEFLDYVILSVSLLGMFYFTFFFISFPFFILFLLFIVPFVLLLLTFIVIISQLPHPSHLNSSPFVLIAFSTSSHTTITSPNK